MAMAEQGSNGLRAHERDESIRSTASTDQLMSGELLKAGNEVREAAFPATSGGYGEQELEAPTIHTGEEIKPRSEEQSTTEAFYDAPVAASDRESVETYEGGSGAMLMKPGNAVQEPSTAGGYGAVSEEAPPTHKIHTDDELLPKPRSNPFAGEENTDLYQDSREAELESFDEMKLAQHGATNEANGALNGRDQEISRVVEPNTFGNGGGEASNERDFSEPTNVDAVPGSKVTQRGYGYVQEDTTEHAVKSAPEHGVEHPAKKEGFIAKMVEKLPGHHKSAETATQQHDISTPVEHHDTSTTSPKKGLMAKIKEKLPGHHATTGHGTTE